MNETAPGTLARTIRSCRVCRSPDLHVFKRSNLQEEMLSREHFRITSADFGRTPELVRCKECGLVQAAASVDAVRYYSEMEDPEYEATREQRRVQARKLLASLPPPPAGGRLLDVGAGSGVLVEEALALGWAAEGIEPSAWLSQRARSRRLPVQTGVLPDARLSAPYDVVCLVDVIEHVDDPRVTLEEVSRCLKPAGLLLVVTPDVNAVAARVMGARWWHYRIAHLSYFGVSTLDRLLEQGGFERETLRRPCWYFPLSYVIARIAKYVPPAARIPLPAKARDWTIPINFLDSIAATYRKR